MKQAVWLAAAMLSITACAGNDTPAPADAPHVLGLADITARIEVTAASNSLVISASFSVPDGGSLPPAASMTASFRASSYALTRSEIVDVPSNSAHTAFTLALDTTAQPVVAAEPVAVSLDLDGVVATSTATVPPGFTVGSVMGSLTSSPLVVAWSPTAMDSFAWTANGTGVSHHTCTVFAPSGLIADSGTLTIDSTMIQVYSYGFPCAVTLSLVRSRPGSLASELAGGTIVATQTRTFWPAP